MSQREAPQNICDKYEKRNPNEFKTFPIQICQRTIKSPGSNPKRFLEPVQQNVSCAPACAPCTPSSLPHAMCQTKTSTCHLAAVATAAATAAATPAVTAFKLVNLSKCEREEEQERERERDADSNSDRQHEECALGKPRLHIH